MKLDIAFRSRCETIAVDRRRRLGLHSSDPLPAQRLLADFNGTAVPPEDLPRHLTNVPDAAVRHLTVTSDWSAAIIWLEPLLIVYNPRHLCGRHEANLMHELGHVLLKHPMIGFSKSSGLPVRDPRHESEATYLGGCLQIPRLALQWAVASGFTAEQIAEYFGASQEMVRFRSNVTRIPVKET